MKKRIKKKRLSLFPLKSLSRKTISEIDIKTETEEVSLKEKYEFLKNCGINPVRFLKLNRRYKKHGSRVIARRNRRNTKLV